MVNPATNEIGDITKCTIPRSFGLGFCAEFIFSAGALTYQG
jgi:hypothetical protein